MGQGPEQPGTTRHKVARSPSCAVSGQVRDASTVSSCPRLGHFAPPRPSADLQWSPPELASPGLQRLQPAELHGLQGLHATEAMGGRAVQVCALGGGFGTQRKEGYRSNDFSVRDGLNGAESCARQSRPGWHASRGGHGMKAWRREPSPRVPSRTTAVVVPACCVT